MVLRLVVLTVCAMFLVGTASAQKNRTKMEIKNDDGNVIVVITTDEDGGIVSVRNAAGDPAVLVAVDDDKNGLLLIRNAAGNVAGVFTALETGGAISTATPDGTPVAILGVTDDAGHIRLSDLNSSGAINLNADFQDRGASIFFFGRNGNISSAMGADGNNDGFLSLSNSLGEIGLGAGIDDTGSAFLALSRGDADQKQLEFTTDADGGLIVVKNRVGDNVVRIAADEDGAGFVEVSGDRAHDLAEPFEFASRDGVVPGTVMSASNEGLSPSDGPYDVRVVGVVSGAGGLRHGMLLGSRSDGTDDLPIALTGQVYVRASLESGPIEVGDLLVASSTPGVAMRANDRVAAIGAVIGKAIAPLAVGDHEGEGLVRILVMSR